MRHVLVPSSRYRFSALFFTTSLIVAGNLSRGSIICRVKVEGTPRAITHTRTVKKNMFLCARGTIDSAKLCPTNFYSAGRFNRDATANNGIRAFATDVALTGYMKVNIRAFLRALHRIRRRADIKIGHSLRARREFHGESSKDVAIEEQTGVSVIRYPLISCVYRSET